MRILFSAVPAYGHVLPMLPLARAARRAGHEVALLAHPSIRDAAPSLPLLEAGASAVDTAAEVERRSGGRAVTSDISLAPEFFVEARLNLGAEEALAAGRDFAPDLLIADMADYLGQLVAAALDVPWAAHGNALPFPPPIQEPMDSAFAARARRLGIEPVAPTSFVDPWPDSLVHPTDVYPAARIPVRPEPHAGDGPPWTRPAFPGREDRPLVLVTLGTVLEDAAALSAILASLDGLDVNVLVAPVPAGALDVVDRSRVHLAGFVPMVHLQRGVEVVVAAGGAGTVLSSLSAGLPMVLLPMGLDKPENAARAAAARAAQVVSAAEEVATAVEKVLGDPSTARAARAVAAEIAAMNSPTLPLVAVLDRAAG